jgi:hypothetical protein
MKSEGRLDENGNFRHRDKEVGFKVQDSRKEKQRKGGEVVHEPQSCRSDLLLGCPAWASAFLVKAVSTCSYIPVSLWVPWSS